MGLVVLVPAAGQSSRMRGADKLLQYIDNLPLLKRQVGRALALNMPVAVTLPKDDTARRDALSDLSGSQLYLIDVPDARDGISASLRAGAKWAQSVKASALMVVLPDLPDLATPDLEVLADLHLAHPDSVLRATDEQGVPGHPTLIPARFFPDMMALQGDTGAGPLLRREHVVHCPLPGQRATTDLDTPEDWAKWRAISTTSHTNKKQP